MHRCILEVGAVARRQWRALEDGHREDQHVGSTDSLDLEGDYVPNASTSRRQASSRTGLSFA